MGLFCLNQLIGRERHETETEILSVHLTLYTCATARAGPEPGTRNPTPGFTHEWQGLKSLSLLRIHASRTYSQELELGLKHTP